MTTNNEAVDDLFFKNLAEGESIDFKRELNLSTPEGKGKFLRTVIAIANSSEYNGYIIVGVDDNKKIVGVNENQEETIQQLCHAYIAPAIRITCEIKLHCEKKLIAIIIDSKNKPYQFSKAISKFNECDVFVRRGSTTTRASVADIIKMHESVKIYKAATDAIGIQNESSLELDITNNIEYIHKLKYSMEQIINNINKKKKEIGNIELSDLFVFEDQAERTEEENAQIQSKIQSNLTRAKSELDELNAQLSSTQAEHEKISRKNKYLMDYKYIRK